MGYRGSHASAAQRPAQGCQECGTIDARSNENSGKFITGDRSLPRSNSIRRSKALERIMGKRASTFSRSVRKSAAIKANGFVMPVWITHAVR